MSQISWPFLVNENLAFVMVSDWLLAVFLLGRVNATRA